MQNNEQPDKAAIQAGIITHWTDSEGQPQTVSSQTQQQLVALMAQTLPDYPHATHHTKRPLPRVLVFREGHNITLALTGDLQYYWTLTTTGNENSIISHPYQGQVKAPLPLILPPSLLTGYYRLVLRDQHQQWDCTIIITPQRCYEPQALIAGKKLWGACIQLYTLRSGHNWGIGDFGDLAQVIKQLGRQGAAFVGLNPLHALYPAHPERASPYSPSSRRWLNIIYIDINAIDEFQRSKSAQQWWHQTETQATLTDVRDTQWVDYPRVMQLKLTALRLAFPLFMARTTDDARMQAFVLFVDQGGESLQQQAIFDALHTWFSEKAPGIPGWSAWPAEYHDPHGSAVMHFCQQHHESITFYLWLQWLAASQLAGCFQLSQQYLMPIGLYLDMAVGVAEDSVETWGQRELYCLQASTGAPPDRLGPLGQNWQLPPLNPHMMTAHAHQPFIDLLRASMKHCGALRLDHVMSLLRLWWIPRGKSASQGAYVSYPLDDLLGILALESQRHHCMIIGEDLGIVPPEIVSRLHEQGVYSYRVLYFEHDSEGHFRAPSHYPRQAMATINTHDLPTLRGYWQGDDLALGHQLGLYPEQRLTALYAEREKSKQGLLNALHLYHCLPKTVDHQATSMPATSLLHAGLQRYLAICTSALLGLQPEDWLDMAMPVNVPGTQDQYPNWRRKLSGTLEALFADPGITRQLQEVNAQRKQAG